MSKNKEMVLGYTRSGHAVLRPAQDVPDMPAHEGWTPGDHLDASRILSEHGEREVDPIKSWCEHWAHVYRSIGKRAKKKQKRAKNAQTQIRGATETSILAGRRR